MSIANFKHLSISGFLDHIFEPSFDEQGRFKSGSFKLKHKSRIGSNKEQTEFCILVSNKYLYTSLKGFDYGTYLYCSVYIPKKDTWILEDFSTMPLNGFEFLIHESIKAISPNLQDMNQVDVEDYWYSHWYKIKTELLPFLNQKVLEIENNNSINKKIKEFKEKIED